MKILVAIANHGLKNLAFLEKLLNEYRSMPFDIDIVVLSNVPKELGKDVEVIVGCPTKDPWSLPFGHKKLFAERVLDYDLFIYSEDDTLITEKNILAFLRSTEVLTDNEVAGFIRYEVDEANNRYYSTIHSHFHWIPGSVTLRAPYTFAQFTNDHSACYMLTREHLKSAIASGGFLVPPHQERYDLLVTAATDPYTQCGLKKVVCVSHIDDFCLPHLPNQYLGRMGLSSEDLRLQLSALMSIASGGMAPDELMNGNTRLKQGRWSKSYYEQDGANIFQLLPPTTKTVLSVGCGWGAFEGFLVDRGIRVTGIPLDHVIGACAEARGVEIMPPNFKKALDILSGRFFDCILFLNTLEYLPDPVRVLSCYRDLLSGDGVVLTKTSNFNHIRVWRDLLRNEITWQQRRDFAVSRLHFTTSNRIKQWLSQSGIRVAELVYEYENRYRKFSNLPGRLLKSLTASQIVVLGRKEE